MLIIAHPDDEVVGAGARLTHLTSSVFVHVTTGATTQFPHEASRRSSELAAAFKLAGLSTAQLQPLGRPDQSLSHVLFDLTSELRCLISEQQPDAVLTHPYEGGHPDHDAVAFAVQAACQTMPQSPPVMEMAFYHQGPQGIRTGEFLPDSETPTLSIQLSPAERALKRSLLECFPSQAQMLSYFQIHTEKFRLSPTYNFMHGPHVGQLFYENFDWGIHSGAEWRALAREALMKLELNQ
jgi:LmbE family N-acetylglucosaminyl deacetylase